MSSAEKLASESPRPFVSIEAQEAYEAEIAKLDAAPQPWDGEGISPNHLHRALLMRLATHTSSEILDAAEYAIERAGLSDKTGPQFDEVSPDENFRL